MSDGFSKLLGAESESAKYLDLKLKSRTWNDAKVSAHHAIVPTQKKLSLAKLTTTLKDDEQKVYQLICRNYIAQFLAKHEFYAVDAEIGIGTGIFIAKAKENIEAGWKRLFPRLKDSNYSEDSKEKRIPRIVVGQSLKSQQAEVKEKTTSPPKPYTDATLLSSMTGISAHVSNPELKKVLRDTDGLGTEATRAGIIELLFKRGYLKRRGKTIYSTQTGQALIAALPKAATQPDLTALWESKLSAIQDGQGSYQELMLPLCSQLESMVGDSQKVIPKGLEGLGSRGSYKRSKNKKKAKKPSSLR